MVRAYLLIIDPRCGRVVPQRGFVCTEKRTWLTLPARGRAERQSGHGGVERELPQPPDVVPREPTRLFHALKHALHGLAQPVQYPVRTGLEGVTFLGFMFLSSNLRGLLASDDGTRVVKRSTDLKS